MLVSGWDGWLGWKGTTDQVPHRETGRDLGFSLERMTGLEPATSTLARPETWSAPHGDGLTSGQPTDHCAGER